MVGLLIEEGPLVKPVSGEGQRLGLAAALLESSVSYLLNEPTNGLDQVGLSGLESSSVQQADLGKMNCFYLLISYQRCKW